MKVNISSFAICVIVVFPAFCHEDLATSDPKSQAQKKDHYGDPLPPHSFSRLGTIRLRAGWGVSALAISSISQRIATIDHYFLGTLRLWDLKTGRHIIELKGDLFEGPGFLLPWCFPPMANSSFVPGEGVFLV